jgi:hypothetical protein
MQAVVMRAFLEGTDEAFYALMNTVRGVGSGGGTVGEQALVGVPHGRGVHSSTFELNLSRFWHKSTS